METITSRRNWLNVLSLLLILPSAWFFCINLLNETGISGPYNATQPILENLGINKTLGWNINLLLLLGPVIALLFSAIQVLNIEWHFSKAQFQFNITIRRKGVPLFIVFLSGLILATLVVYLVAENCNC